MRVRQRRLPDSPTNSDRRLAEPLSHNRESFVCRGRMPLKLRILRGLEHRLELRTRTISSGDQIFSGHEQMRLNLFNRSSFVARLGKVIQPQIAVRVAYVHPMKREMLVKLRQPQ